VNRSIDVVANPRAGGGRASRRLGDVCRELARVGFSVNVHQTARPGHATEIVRTLVSVGVETIGVLGGDGTVHEALNGLFEPTKVPQVTATQTAFAVLPAGTGGDLRKTLGIPEEPAEIARYVADARPVAFDVGIVKYTAHDGGAGESMFVNIASFGVGGLVDQLVASGPKWLGGKAAYLTAGLRANLRYRNAPVRIVVDDELMFEGPLLNAAVANGRAFGGGMFIAPNADPHDGLFDIVVLGDMTLFESIGLSGKLYRGAHLSHPKVSHRRGRRVRAEKIGTLDALMDIDGEAPGRVDASFEIVPGAVRMLERS